MERFSAYKTIEVTLKNRSDNLSQYGEVLQQEGVRSVLRVRKSVVSQVTARILAEQPVDDLSVESPPIEDVIEKVFSQRSTSGEAP